MNTARPHPQSPRPESEPEPPSEPSPAPDPVPDPPPTDPNPIPTPLPAGDVSPGTHRSHVAPIASDRRVPRSIKAAQTGFVIALVPVYWRQYGPGNFLWFSDVGLLVSVPALWLESPLLASTQLLGVLVPESLWAADFAAGALSGKTPLSLASYMFDRRIPRFVRALSLFHLWMPVLLVFLVSRTGYDRRAWRYQAWITCVLLAASAALTRPEDNVNWVYSFRDRIHSAVGRAAFVAFLALAIPLAFQWPVHVLFTRWARRGSRTCRQASDGALR